MDYDIDVPDDGMPPEEHQRAFEELQAKDIADARALLRPRVRGPLRIMGEEGELYTVFVALGAP